MTASILERPTLVLNRSWQPVRISSVARSIVMVFNDAARIVDPESYALYTWEDWAALEPKDNEPVISAVGASFRVPEVVTLTRYDRVPQRGVSFNRRNLFKRDRYTCQYCGCRPGNSELSVDHIQPRSQGGLTTWTNCVLACVSCNARKADRTPHQAHMRLKKEPIQPTWQPLYAENFRPIESWSKFLSEAYWSVELRD
jgi:5-methylcytosine-specific restriction endonuclease McrA